MRHLLVCSALSGLLLLGCASESDVDKGDLVLGQQGQGLAGSFTSAKGSLTFTTAMVEADVFDIVIQLNGLTITALVDRTTGVMEYDGYALDGTDTQIVQADRDLLLDFSRALDELGTQVAAPVAMLRGFANTWAEFPTTLELARQALAEKDRSYASICWAKNSYQSFSHDDWDYDWWDDASTIENGYVSMHAAGGCDDGTYFWTGSYWSCYEPDHSSSVEYAYGNCFARCGASCGSDTQFTWDCGDHDECVRVGHSTASLWCDDEFTGTVDDWASAPNC